MTSPKTTALQSDTAPQHAHEADPDPEQRDAVSQQGDAGSREGKTPASIIGFPPIYFAVIFAVILAAAWTGTLPDTMIAGFAAAVTLGGLLFWLGNLVPVIRDFGLPTIFCTFVPAILVFAGVVPQPLIDVVSNFTGGYGFLDFFVMSVIAGSILGMPRKLLMTAGPRFLVPLVGCILLTFVGVGALGAIFGFGFRDAMLFVSAPVMAGGIGLGAIPMSEMYADAFGGSTDAYMSDLISAVVLANIVCILVAGFYSGMDKRRQLFVGFNGKGELLRMKGERKDFSLPKKRTSAEYGAMAKGLLIAGTLFVLGTMVGTFVPDIHPYAWAIMFAAVIKIFGLLPKDLEEATAEWSDFAMSAWIPALLVGVSLSYIDVGQVLGAFQDPVFLLLTAASVVMSGLIAGALGWLVKMNFVEASITPGLCMADTGGSGDVSVLSAGNRLHMMPFAALTTRLGGVLTLLIATLLVAVM